MGSHASSSSVNGFAADGLFLESQSVVLDKSTMLGYPLPTRCPWIWTNLRRKDTEKMSCTGGKPKHTPKFHRDMRNGLTDPLGMTTSRDNFSKHRNHLQPVSAGLFISIPFNMTSSSNKGENWRTPDSRIRHFVSIRIVVPIQNDALGTRRLI